MSTDLELKAPLGKYRVIAVDTFDGTDWIVGEYDDYVESLQSAKDNGGTMQVTHIYDDKGKHLVKAGSF